MARINTYSNDNTVTVGDKVVGTDALDGSTKNFTIGDILALGGASGVTYTAGTGIDITNNVITCTVTDTDTLHNELLVYQVPADVNPEPTVQPLDMTVLARQYQSKGYFDVSAIPAVINSSGSVLITKITMNGFARALSNNVDITYTLQDSNDGSTWNNVKSVSRTKSATGEYADTFSSYFSIDPGKYIRIVVSSTTGNVVVQAGTQVEFEAID